MEPMANNEKTKQYLNSLNEEQTFASASKLTVYEREFYLNYNEFDKVWIAESSIPKFWRRLEKRNWICTGVQYYSDGSICSKTFTSNSPKGITITDPTKAKREMTEEQKQKAAERIKQMHNKRKENKEEINNG
jgi:hypothetical protein